MNTAGRQGKLSRQGHWRRRLASPQCPIRPPQPGSREGRGIRPQRRQPRCATLAAGRARRGPPPDRQSLLTSTGSCVLTTRVFAGDKPPDPVKLAELLTRLSGRESAAGDRVAALASIEQAVEIRRQLAETNPAAFLPNLAGSLNNLSSLLTTGNEATAARRSWHETIESSPHPVARAELRTHFARYLAAQADQSAAVDRLVLAVRETTGEVDTRMVSRARLAIRAAAAGVADSPRLPRWARDQIPDEHRALVSEWMAQTDWPAVEAYLRNHVGDPAWPGLRASLALLDHLYPETEAIAALAAILDEIATRGLDEVLARGAATHERHRVLDAWIATETWVESERFLAGHRDSLTAPATRELLASSDTEAARQHLAIIALADDLPLDRVFDIVSEDSVAAEVALEAVESGDLARLAVLLCAAPAVLGLPVTGAVLLAVLALADDDAERAQQLAQHVAEAGTAIERRATAVRLRSLARRLPHLEAATALADFLDPATP
jgi:hypothetical protein